MNFCPLASYSPGLAITIYGALAKKYWSRFS